MTSDLDLEAREEIWLNETKKEIALCAANLVVVEGIERGKLLT